MNAEHEAVNNAFFRRYAPMYDLLTLPLVRIRRRVATLGGMQNGTKVLDVACGTGNQSFAFARAGGHVMGIDLSPDMVNKAKTKMRGSSIEFRVGDATVLPFHDGAFDVSSISFALHDMPEDMGLSILKEMKRVTKTGGLVVIVDYRPPQQFLSRLIHRILARFESRYYHRFITQGITRYAENAALRVQKKEAHLFGVVEIVVCRM